MPSPFSQPYQNEPIYQTNLYACANCAAKWEDDWYCGCDDECPICGTLMTPHDEQIIAMNPQHEAT